MIQIPSQSDQAAASAAEPDPLDYDPLSDPSVLGGGPPQGRLASTPKNSVPVVPILIGVGGVGLLAVVALVIVFIVGGGDDDPVVIAVGNGPNSIDANDIDENETGPDISPSPAAPGEASVTASNPAETEAASGPAPSSSVGGGVAAPNASQGTRNSNAAKPPTVDPRTLVSIPMPINGPVVYSNGPYVGLADKVYSMETWKVVGQFAVETRSNRGWYRLSDDGKWFATVERADRTQRLRWSSTQTDTGFWIELGRTSAHTYLMYFQDDGQLVWIGEHQSEPKVLTFAMDSAEPVKVLPLQQKYQHGALHPDGEHIALERFDDIDVINLETGKVVGQMKFKRSVNSFAFSPDGTKLAIASRHAENFLIVVDQTGKEIYRAPLSIGLASGSNFDSEMQWMPDGSGWFLTDTTILDREVKVPVFELRRPWAYGQILDANTFAGTRYEDGQRHFFIKKLPKEKIDAAVRQHLASAASLVRPKPTVAIEFQFGNLVGGNQAELMDEYNKMWSEKLTAVEATVGDGGEYVLTIIHDEQMSEPTKIGVVESPTGVGRVTYREIRQPLISATVRVTDRQGNEAWSETAKNLKSTGFAPVAKVPTLDELRQSALHNSIFFRMKDFRLPKVISGEDPLVLPIVES